MQGTRLGLALAVLLYCLALAGCGGGGDEGSSSTEAQSVAESKQEAVAKLGDAAKRIREERGDAAQGNPAQGNPEGTAEAPEAEGKDAGQVNSPERFDPRPANPHNDSGGGTEQFAAKTGDNSIQESGHEADQSETEEAAAVLHAYLDARVAHHWEEACFYLSAGFTATIELFAERYAKEKGVEGCPEVLEALAGGSSQKTLEETAEIDVGALRREGDHGFVLYHGPGAMDYAMPMAREGGAWKVGSLDGAPLL